MAITNEFRVSALDWETELRSQDLRAQMSMYRNEIERQCGMSPRRHPREIAEELSWRCREAGVPVEYVAEMLVPPRMQAVKVVPAPWSAPLPTPTNPKLLLLS